ncbi:MAG: glycosyltransferase [Candidatus Kapaibacterium sp.]|nr:MAG: glycosyltransferase [Candidatus Kapabacteria bacterium]
MKTPLTYIVFARTPRLGQGKTRLASDIGAEAAFMLYEAMLVDTLHTISMRNAASVLLFAFPPEAESVQEMEAWCKAHQCWFPELCVLPQTGATLGEQMYRAFCSAFETSPHPAIILGTDSPTIPHRIWDAAEEALQTSNSAVLGRSSDGGFYAMGLSGVDESLFFGNAYSNDTVYARTHAALQGFFSTVLELPEWTDIDDLASLGRVLREARTREEAHEYELVKRIEELQANKLFPSEQRELLRSLL